MLDWEHPAVMFANGLGDHFLALPALRALARLFPMRLTLVCMPGARQTFFADLPLRAVCETTMGRIGGTRSFDAVAVAQGLGTADLLLSLNPWHSPAVDRLLDLLAPSRSIGFHPSFETALPLDFNKHSAELAFDVPRRLDPALRLEDFAAPPTIPSDARQRARELRALVPAPMRVLAVHADTGLWKGGETKMWNADQFTLLLDAFLSRHPDFVALVVGISDVGLDRGRCGRRVISCCGLPLDTSMALVSEADLFVGVDSCMLHAADLHRVPGVGLFGPTNPLEFGFRFARHRHVRGSGSMEDIGVDAVLGALEQLLEGPDTVDSLHANSLTFTG